MIDQDGQADRSHLGPVSLVPEQLRGAPDRTPEQRLMAALLEAELNINYLYSFIPQPQGKSIVGLSMEDNETAEQALRRHQFRTLRQTDISR